MFKPVHNGDRIRYSYARIKEVLKMPHLIDLQRKSYEWFIREGLHDVFKDVSPIKDFTDNLELSFENFTIGDPKYDIETCKEKDATYAAPLNVDVRLLYKDTGEIKESTVFMGDFPLMTDTGTFVINGAERVIVSQLVRSPGVYYAKDMDPMGKFLYGTTVIPNRGAWIEYETDLNDIIYARVDRTRKLPATALLRVMGLPTNDDIIQTFGEHPFLMATLAKDTTKNEEDALLEIYRKLRPGEPANLENAAQLIKNIFSDNRRYDLANVGRYKVNKKLGWRQRLLGKELTSPIAFENPDGTRGEVVLPAGTIIGDEEIDKIEQSGIYSQPGYAEVWVKYQEKPEQMIVTKDIDSSVRVITPADVIASFAYLLNVIDGMEGKDDIDHLGNRRVRCVGELLQNQFRIGLSRMERVIRERMTLQDADVITPQALINIRPVVAAVKEFFGSSQLSQFMDQNNPLAELTHKRRLSALGPGGLSRERAGYEVRDVHVSHYGRMCPIETPEGPNIGLIGSLAAYGVVNRYGFIETPYRKVDKKTGKVTNEIVYMTADEEDNYIVAQANEPLNDDGTFVNSHVTCRERNDVLSIPPSRVDFMDVSPKQVMSIAAALIPFLENDDANRALMGANMQRQAVPLLNPKAPVVGTGMEYKVAVDSGVCILAKHAGTVKYVSGDKIIVTRADGAGIDEYNVLKFKRSNQSTCVNQRPIVFKGDKVEEGQVLADGPATDHGELALGRNAIAAYMPWEGYNYEDAVLLSEDLVKEDVFTSIHIEEYNCDARDTKLGPEEITRDIPNVSEEALKDLDEDGIIRIGAEVRPGDILVGKVTPKGETELSAEERLIRAIFAEKAREVRDSSLRVPHGESGIIVSVQIFTRENGDELPPGVSKQVRVHIVQKRKISEGDKMAGRHGNKGVVSRIMPREDMPFLPNGEPVQIVLNPLGVPSRMNIGQILEAHLGWAACALGMRIESGDPKLAGELKEAGYDVDKYGMPETVDHAVPVAVPVFDSAREDDMEKTLQLAGVDPSGKTTLYDGRTGEPFDNPVTVGCIYYLKLHHLVADKIHARSTGPYSLVTQQPLGGKAQFGGQRFGEMEVWALEAYGAAYTLQEILTVKSDDVVGRVKAYEAIVKGENIPEPGVPESFKVLVKEMQSIGLDIQVLDEDDDEIDLDDEDEDIGMGDIARELDMDMANKAPHTAANVGEEHPEQNSGEELSPDEDQPEGSDFDVIADIGNMSLDDSHDDGDDNGSDAE
ncbi:DNA-directed RNA polymerase subunit beta [Acidaminococcus fermentans]|uniref:DNA-directed RNA polymerase subunit beta n=6 Tax=Acidaminococcus fermentans TaxID=905 RepID=D2RNX3_ACIFV|nr:DNA-directed RNA polymerase subunit beta [Acidaminococcus fermentans]ADB46749.1 DNA-directed RNA polymerase, beta subunit [Acidaminococcus fermentans DSM 20731]MCF0139308.1 DNA-directed RNA polymerase subunit beta [Acidaminococcus fermentans]MCI7194448.1 DNA-directed RNA polymerase subunit beta [Acidaminococcus fermentans]MDD6286843.1 DNA-directed RNA polymerase subunit beta [Acidaminococcus fermentans]MDD7195512.1 DNA-directed RNA polymerase subunit beta [Acidaminococcus fermentans]